MEKIKYYSNVRNHIAGMLREELKKFLQTLADDNEFEYYEFDIADRILEDLYSQDVLKNILNDMRE